MAYSNFPNVKYVTSNHHIVIEQEFEYKFIGNEKHLQMRFSVQGKYDTKDIDITTNWINFPFKKGKNIVNTVLNKIPQLKNSKGQLFEDIFPIIDVSYKTAKHTHLCSSYILRDGEQFKLYEPMVFTLERFDKVKKRNGILNLTNGVRARSVKVSDVIEIIEE